MSRKINSWGLTYTERNNFALLAMMIFFLLFLNACGTVKPICTVTDQVSFPALGSKTNVFVFRPLLAFERLHDEAPLDSFAFHGRALENRLKSEFEAMLKNRKIEIAAPGIRKEVLTSNFPAEIRKKLPKLSRGLIDKESTTLLQSLASYDENMTILVNYVDVKVGSRGSWDPNTGLITSQNSKSLFRAALFQCSTGQLLWKDEIFLRELPELSSERFAESIDLLLLNFPCKKDQT